MTRDELEQANEAISVSIREASDERERLTVYIDTLRNQHLENAQAINRMLREEIAAATKVRRQ